VTGDHEESDHDKQDKNGSAACSRRDLGWLAISRLAMSSEVEGTEQQ
jgi:hypothetical protein